MTFNLQFLVFSVLKIVAVLAWVYFVLWALGRKPLWAKLLGALVAFGIVQLALTKTGDFQVMNDFDRGLLFQACSMTMVALGLNLIYGFNGQFSLGQWGFYGLGAYAAADITYRWVNQDASGVFVAGLGVLLGGAMILGVGRLVKRYKGMPILSQFTLYLIGAVLAGFLAVVIGNPIARRVCGRLWQRRCARHPAKRPDPAGGLPPGGADRRRVRGRGQLPVRPAGVDAG